MHNYAGLNEPQRMFVWLEMVVLKSSLLALLFVSSSFKSLSIFL